MSESNELVALVGEAFNNPEFSDCEVHVENVVFNVNKMMLKLHSDVFRAYFNHDSQERQTGIIKIEDTSSRLVELMLRFMYTNKVENLDEISYDLFILADRYNVVILKNLCAQRLIENISVENIFNCLEVAYLLNAEELKQKCLQFVVDNEAQIQTNDEWTRVTNSEPSISRDLCRLLFERLRSLNPPQENDIEILEVVEGTRPNRTFRIPDIDALQAETLRLNERFREHLRQIDERLRVVGNNPLLVPQQNNPEHQEAPEANQVNAQREEVNFHQQQNPERLAEMRAERRVAARRARQENPANAEARRRNQHQLIEQQIMEQRERHAERQAAEQLERDHQFLRAVSPAIIPDDNEEERELIELDPEPQNQERVLRPRRRPH